MKIALIGGHMAPALGLLAALPKKTDVIYIGRQHVFEGDAGTSLEYETMKKRGIRFINLPTGRVQRVLTAHTLPSLFKIPQGFTHAFSILKKEKPDVVVGFGGYVSVPIGIAAALQKIPLIIHESSLSAGLANKILSVFATKICIAWDSSRAYFPKDKTILTGNPFLPFKKSSPKDIMPISKEQLPLIVISGGSGGSHAINKFTADILPRLLEIGKVIHQTGDAKEYGDYAMLLAKKETLPKKLQERYSVVKFIDPDDINGIFAISDIVVGRSGINTVATLLLLKKKCVLIPLPTGQKNEQLENARLLQVTQLATILDQTTLTPDKLYKIIQETLLRKVSPSQWEIPIPLDGATNLVKEVFACLPKRHQEE